MSRQQALLVLYVALCVALWALLCFGIRGVANDYYWHLRSGELMLLNHTWFVRDPFSWTYFRQPWFNHEWLAQVIYALLDRLGGYPLVKTAHGLLILAYLISLASILRCGGTPFILNVGLVSLAGFCTYAISLPRPQAISMVGTVAFARVLYGVQVGRASRLALWSLPLLLIPWANCHAGFAAGPAWIAMTLVGESGQRFLPGSASPPVAGPTWRTLVGIGLAGCSAALVNPHGWELYRLVFQAVLDPQIRLMNTFVGEWRPPDWTQLPHMLLLLYAAPMLAACLMTWRRARCSLLIWCVVTLAATTQSIRHIPFTVIALTALGAHHLPACLGLAGSGHGCDGGRTGWKRVGPFLIALWLMATAAGVGWEARTKFIHGAFQPVPFPSAAALHRLQHLPTEQRMFNYFGWGGLFIYYLYPRQRVYVDGRLWTLYDAPHIWNYSQLIDARGEWRHILDRQGINLIVVRPQDRIVDAARHLARWQAWYTDDTVAVLRRAP